MHTTLVVADAQKSGVAQETVKSTNGKIGQMSPQEAQMVLGIEKDASWGEVVKRYKHLFEINEKHGSFYLQSKVYRAKESLEDEYKASGRFVPEDEPADSAKQGQGQERSPQ
jgi:import inner membrane translocase subunit TIM16